jgi:hypothetical protein
MTYRNAIMPLSPRIAPRPVRKEAVRKRPTTSSTTPSAFRLSSGFGGGCFFGAGLPLAAGFLAPPPGADFAGELLLRVLLALPEPDFARELLFVAMTLV